MTPYLHTAQETREYQKLVGTSYQSLIGTIHSDISSVAETLNPVAYTTTVEVTEEDFDIDYIISVKGDLIKLGYGVDDSTTPGSWIISW